MKKHTDGDYNEKKLKTLGETPTKKTPQLKNPQ